MTLVLRRRSSMPRWKQRKISSSLPLLLVLRCWRLVIRAAITNACWHLYVYHEIISFGAWSLQCHFCTFHRWIMQISHYASRSISRGIFVVRLMLKSAFQRPQSGRLSFRFSVSRVTLGFWCRASYSDNLKDRTFFYIRISRSSITRH